MLPNIFGALYISPVIRMEETLQVSGAMYEASMIVISLSNLSWGVK